MYPRGRRYMDMVPPHGAEYLTWYSWSNMCGDDSCEVDYFRLAHNDVRVQSPLAATAPSTPARNMDAVISRAADGYWHEGIAYGQQRHTTTSTSCGGQPATGRGEPNFAGSPRNRLTRAIRKSWR